MNFTEQQVEQYEIFAEALSNFDYVSDSMEKTFLMIILNIESLLPYSNIFEYVIKTDLYKNEKLNLENKRKDKFERINELVLEMELLYSGVDVINNKLSTIDNHIDESEWQIESNSNEEITFNEIKQKLIIEKKLNYGSI
jgi:hypothetical protein